MNRYVVPELFSGVDIPIFLWPTHKIPNGSGCVGQSIILDQDKTFVNGRFCDTHIHIYTYTHELAFCMFGILGVLNLREIRTD